MRVYCTHVNILSQYTYLYILGCIQTYMKPESQAMVKAEQALRVAAKVSRGAMETFQDLEL